MKIYRIFIMVVAGFVLSTQPAPAQSTAFNYQGFLQDGVIPANGSYDLVFALYNTNSAGTLQGNLLTNSATLVTNGLFMVTLDFGNQFTGGARWLQIGVRTNGGSAFITLTPRQQVTATPYAIQAATAGSVAATNITGTIMNSSLPAGPTYSGTVTAGGFSGSGAGLAALNAGNITVGTLSDARLSSNVALLNAGQTFTGANTFNNPANNFAGAFNGAFTGNGSGLTNLNPTVVTNNEPNVSLAGLFTVVNPPGAVNYEQHIDQETGEPLVTFQREGDPASYAWNSKIFQWADVGATYNSLFDAYHNYAAGLSVFRMNGATPYLGGGDNRGYVELCQLYGTNGNLGGIWELLPRKALNSDISSGLFAHPLRADGYGRVMIGNIPESIHTVFVPANASLEIVAPPADTAQFHMDPAPAFTGTWASGDIRFDGSRYLFCQQGVTMPVPQMQQTNLNLSAATSFVWQFTWPFADTNYSVSMPTGSAPFSGFYIGAKTVSSVQLFFNSYTGQGDFMVQHQ